jgi:hypothetical protein
MKGKYSMSVQKFVKNVPSTSLNKKEFIKGLIKEGSTIVWPKEMKMAKILLQIFPNEDFWSSLKLNFKLNSLCWLLSDDGRKFLNTEYKKFNLDLPEAKTFEVDNNNIAFENKSSYDLDKALNLREFLNLWQKKL